MSRWSRRRAQERWRELGVFTGRPLWIGLFGVGMWPAAALAVAWPRYAQPLVAVAVYVASLLLLGALCLRGPHGIGLLGSVGSGLAVATLNIVLTAQVPAGEPFAEALWLQAWGAAVPLVLALCRPVEEPVAILGLLVATNVAAVIRADLDAGRLAEAAHMGLVVPFAVSGIVLAGALRASVGNARRDREESEKVALRERVRTSVDEERAGRFARWEERIAPLLDEVASGRRSSRDAALGARCRALADALRADLARRGGSVLDSLLPRPPGVELTIRDLDVGHRLVAAERIALADLVRAVCAGTLTGSLQLTLLADAAAPATRAVAILAADGLPPPAGPLLGTLIADGPDRWWYDVPLRCEAAPALAASVDQ